MQYGIPKNYGTGIGNFFASMAGGGRTSEDAYYDEMERLSGMALNRAKLDDYRSKAQERMIRQNALSSMPQVMSNLPETQASQLGDFISSGRWEIPVEAEGPYQPGQEVQYNLSREAPQWATPDVMDRYRRGMQLQNVVGASTTANPMQIMQAMGVGDMMAGQSGQDAYARAFAAAQGKPLYNQGTQGVLHQMTGQLNTTPVAQSQVAKNQAMAGAYQARADKYRDDIGSENVDPRVGLIEHLVAKGMPREQANTWVLTNANPELMRKLYTEILKEQYLDAGNAIPPLPQLIEEVEAAMQGVPAPAPAPAYNPADPLNLGL